MNYKLFDLIDVEKNQRLLDSFCDVVGIAAAIIDLEGEVILGSRWQRICTDFHRVNDRACEKCIESDTQLANELQQGKRFSIYKCRNGLTDAASPIIIEGGHIANVFVGQFLLKTPDQEFFRQQAHAYGFEETDYLEALSEVPIVTEENLPAILDFLTTFAEMVAHMGLEHLRQIENEEALRESEEKYRKILESIEEGYFEVDNAGNFTSFNDSLRKILGYSKDELMGMNNRQYIDEENAKKLYKTFNKVYTTGKPDKSFDWEIIRKDGGKRYVEASASLIRDPEGQPIGFSGIVRDVTERKLAEEALRREEEKFRVLVEKSPLGVSLIGEDGHYEYLNPKFIEMFGYTVEDIPAGRDWFIKAFPDSRYRHEVISTWMEDLEEYETGESRPRSFKVTCKDGSEKEVYFRPVTMETGEQFVICEDITERIRLEAQLQQATKMEAIGTLAGGIAHEFNNALTVIAGNLQFLEMELPENESVRKYSEEMKSSYHRMVKLTKQLLAYSRGGKYQPKALSLSDFVEETLSVLKSEIDPSIKLDTDLPKDIFSVIADPIQMQMVLSAVVNNSSEGIEGEGRIKISTSNEEIDEDFAKDRPDLNPGCYACLRVEDNGKGMDEATVSKIFDPFFTTKFLGRGLGMAAVYGIIKNHDGWISVYSEPGKWTGVSIYLPVLEVKEEKVEEKPLKEPEAEIIRGTGTILVIEDEEMIMNLTRAILERLGYRVLEAGTGKEAVEVVRTFDGDIDLALLDIKLPDIGGDKLYPRIMEARPNLKVIVCSGYSIDGTAQEILDAGAQDFIQKPFSVETLPVKLKEILGD